MNGKVWLVGAGPGDAGLLTVKGAALLRGAEVVVYDRLVSAGVLAGIPTTAERVDAGKTAGHHPISQEKINALLVQYAEAGKHVVRLKGGDPFVFGRGGEELECLVKAGIPFEVVPGVTSSIAAAAYAGIPVTHRGYTSSLHIITGHAKQGATLELDYDALVRLKGTLVFMMSLAHVGELARGLQAAGMKSDMPAAVVENGTCAVQRQWTTTLGALEKTVQVHAVQSPSILLVGHVCALSEQLNWFIKRPLYGKRIAVTRPQKTASVLVDKLESLGASVTVIPCTTTKALPFTAACATATALAFTSAVGVEFFFEKLFQDGHDARILAGKKLLCVGSQTARALRRFGLCADFVPTVFDGEHLAAQAIQNGVLTRQDHVLLLRAKNGAPQLLALLQAANIVVEDRIVYESQPLSFTCNKSFDWVTFTSKSCVEGFVAAARKLDFTTLRALCIGAQTAKEAEAHGFLVVQSASATLDSMVETLLKEEQT